MVVKMGLDNKTTTFLRSDPKFLTLTDDFKNLG